MTLRRKALVLIVILASYSLSAQSNQQVDALLSQNSATYAESAYMALCGGGWIAEDVTAEEAFKFAESVGWIAAGVEPEAPIDLAAFSLLAMKGLRVKGGLGYTIFGGKRYAYRELVARGIVNDSGGSSRVPSGEEVIRMLGKTANLPRGTK